MPAALDEPCCVTPDSVDMLRYVVVTDVILGAVHNLTVGFTKNDLIAKFGIAVVLVGAMVLIPSHEKILTSHYRSLPPAFVVKEAGSTRLSNRVGVEGQKLIPGGCIAGYSAA